MQREISHSLGCLMSVFLARSALRKDLSSLVCKLCHFAICLCCSPSFTEKVKLSSTPCKSGQQPWHCAVPSQNAFVSVGKESRSQPLYNSCLIQSCSAVDTSSSLSRVLDGVSKSSFWPRLFPDPVSVNNRIPDTLICSAILTFQKPVTKF